MKTIIAVMGSPRHRGDSVHFVSLIEAEMKKEKDIDFRYVFLKDRNIEYCRGCLLCMRKGEDACPIDDDVAELRKELLTADGIIFASPVYVHQVTALMKNFFDRFAFFMHRPAFHGKPALLLTTTEISGAPETLDFLRFCADSWGFTVVESLWVLADGMKMECRYRRKMMRNAAIAGNKMCQAIENSSLPKPSTEALRFFRKLRTKVIIHRDKLPYDYQYWKEKGWLKQSYFYEVRIGPLQKLIVVAPVLIIILRMKLKLGSDLFRAVFLEPMRSHRL